MENRTTQRRICLRERSDQEILTDHCDPGHAAIHLSGEVDSKDSEIESITLNRSGRHLGRIRDAAIYAVHLQRA